MRTGVSITTNSREVAERQRLRAKAVQEALAASVLAHAEAVKAKAEALSRGTMARRQQRQYRPGFYSVQLPGDAHADAVINAVSGRFASSWRLSVLTVSGGVAASVWNVSPESQYLAAGTVRMRKRDTLGQALQDTPPPAVFALAAARAAEQSV